MGLMTSTPRCVGGIGHLQMIYGNRLCDVFVTTGAIEKLSHGPTNDLNFVMTASAFEEIARRKLSDGRVQSDRIWIRSLDVPEWI